MELGEESKEPEALERESGGQGSFGVKSYLHKFYEGARADFDEAIFEQEEGGKAYLTSQPRYPCAYSTRWRTLLTVGILVVLVGSIVLTSTHALPLKTEVVGYKNESVLLVDQSAVNHNHRVNSAKLASLISICLGGIAIAVAILVPIHFKEDDEYPPDHSIAVPITTQGYTQIPNKEDTIQASSSVHTVQPAAANNGVIPTPQDSTSAGIAPKNKK